MPTKGLLADVKTVFIQSKKVAPCELKLNVKPVLTNFQAAVERANEIAKTLYSFLQSSPKSTQPRLRDSTDPTNEKEGLKVHAKARKKL